MARDISELGADVIDDTPVDPKHKMSKKKKNYIIGLSITGVLVVGIVIGTVVLAKTALSDYSNVENVTYYFNPQEEGAPAVLYKLKSDYTYPSTFRIPSQVNGHKVVGVAAGAFASHKEFKKIVMPNTLKFVGEKAFYNCENLASFSWSKNLDDVGVDAFLNTKYYNNLVKDTKSITYLPSGLLIYVGKDYFENGTALVSSELQNATIDSIATQYGVDNVKEIKVFEKIGINKMCSGAFKDNDKIVFIDLPTHLNDISNSTFEGCKNLQALDATHSGVVEIDKRAFANCIKLKNILLPSNLNSVGDEAFKNTGLVDRIPDLSHVESLGESLFADCKSLVSLTYTGSNVPAYAFSNCSVLSNIEWGVDNANIDNVTSIGIGAFSGTAFTQFNFPKNVSFVADELFKDCSTLTTVGMYEGRFYTSPALEDPDEDEAEMVDYYDYNGQKITANASVGINSIRASAFENCTSLKTIKLLDTDYLDVSGKCEVGTFNFPMTLLKTDVAMTSTGSNNKTFANTQVEKINILPNLKTIGSYAFNGCSHLTEVNFLYSEHSILTSVKSNAFEGCSSLASMTFPTTISTLGSSVFKNCTSLVSVNVGELSKVETFQASLFSGCTHLGNVTIPNKVRNIKEYAFYMNYALEYVIINTNINAIQNKAFGLMRENDGEQMPIYFNFTYSDAKKNINYKENLFCDETCKAYYLLGEGETADPNLNYWHDVGGVPTPYTPA